ncbi:cytochrome b [Variovorax sp. J22R24]|uniref:cytochrome b n=1 Tax=Variovorax gracilis TaxID=3053502 RepID=UPI0025780074|nr:cytochrome b [Variovorax sp. J22R24]MDM0105801.1 cytochrome b [Variovorax sp. J22R24]
MRPNLTPTPPGGAESDAAWSASIRFLHWVVATLIFTQFALGWLAVGWRLSPTKINLFVWHKSVGILILALVLIRLLNRLTKPTPALPPDTPAWERIAARWSHALLYVLMIAMPLTGWVINSAAGIPFRIFWQVPLPALMAPDKHTADIAALVHFALGVALAGLLMLHIGAALRHHFVKRNSVLIRMLRARRTGS